MGVLVLLRKRNRSITCLFICQAAFGAFPPQAERRPTKSGQNTLIPPCLAGVQAS